eukprot:m.1282975 g.1282975  ORF g.1282975 m.1282975 type:complete len:854 (-) comp24776_c0_seq51:2098-4659(-)
MMQPESIGAMDSLEHFTQEFLHLWSDAIAKSRRVFPKLLTASQQSYEAIPSLAQLWRDQESISMQQRFKLLVAGSLVVASLITVVMWLYRTCTALTESTKPRTYLSTRIVLVRAMSMVYLAAFSTSAFQGRAMYGSNGVQVSEPIARPTPIFDFITTATGEIYRDWMHEAVSYGGIFLSTCQLLKPTRTPVIPVLLWLSYLSIVNRGTGVINYGWEWLTLELGFLTVFLCPLLPLRWLPCGDGGPSCIVIWLFRWCAFRLLIGAGMSKIGSRSSACWQELSCTSTHYFTQPMPNPIAWYAHHAPEWFHRLEVALTFFEQLVLPFFLLVPQRRVAMIAGSLEIFFQVSIVLTGNYAWINWVGALPCLAVFDDQAWSWLIHRRSLQGTKRNTAFAQQSGTWRMWVSTMHSAATTAVAGIVLVFIGLKSAEPLLELYSPSPWLHYYDDYFFVNSQGVFGFINQKRAQPVLFYTHANVTALNASCTDAPSGPGLTGRHGEWLQCADLAEHCAHGQFGAVIRTACARTCGTCRPPRESKVTWHVLAFKNLPGCVHQRPFFNSPYHYRFDWEVWIRTTAGMDAATEGPQQVPGILHSMIAKILRGDTDAMSLMGTTQHQLLQGPGQVPPTAIKLQYYWYKFTEASPSVDVTGERSAGTDSDTASWWQRTKLGDPTVYFSDWSPETRLAVCCTSERQWLLLLASVGCAVCCRAACARAWDVLARSVAAVVGAACTAAFVVALGSDYDARGTACRGEETPESPQLAEAAAAVTAFLDRFSFYNEQFQPLHPKWCGTIWQLCIATAPVLIAWVMAWGHRLWAQRSGPSRLQRVFACFMTCCVAGMTYLSYQCSITLQGDIES